MQKESLTALVRHQLETASTATSGRSAHTVFGGHERVLSQTLIAGETEWNGSPGDLMTIPTPATPSRPSRTRSCS